MSFMNPRKTQLSSKAEKIAFLEAEVTRLQKNASQQKQIPFKDISAEAKANYENLASLQYDNAVITDFNKTDTLTIFEVKWKQGLASSKIESENKRVYEWLKVRLKDTTIQLRGASK